MRIRRTPSGRIGSALAPIIAATLCFANVASAEVIHSGPQNISIPWVSGTTHLDLDGDGNHDFAFHDNWNGVMDGVIAGNESVGFDPYFGLEWFWDLVRVQPGEAVSATSPAIVPPQFGEWRNQWRDSNDFVLWPPQGITPDYLPGEDMYAGVRFVIDPSGAATTHYGWIHVIPYHSYPSSPSPLEPGDLGTILEWAYESEPETEIVLGATPEVVPGPAPILLVGAIAALAIAKLRGPRPSHS
jgi:hypothetical protein